MYVCCSYNEFHPFLFHQHQNGVPYVEFESFDKVCIRCAVTHEATITGFYLFGYLWLSHIMVCLFMDKIKNALVTGLISVKLMTVSDPISVLSWLLS